MRLHRREHRSEIRQRLGQMLFHIEYDRRTARGDDRRIARLGGELFQLLLDQIGAFCSFVCRREAKRLERLFDTPKTGGVKIGDVRRVDAYDDLFSRGDQLPDLADVAISSFACCGQTDTQLPQRMQSLEMICA